jgi:hypothetical protein
VNSSAYGEPRLEGPMTDPTIRSASARKSRTKRYGTTKGSCVTRNESYETWNCPSNCPIGSCGESPIGRSRISWRPAKRQRPSPDGKQAPRTTVREPKNYGAWQNNTGQTPANLPFGHFASLKSSDRLHKLSAGPFSLEWKRRATDVEDDLGLPRSISKGEIGGAAGKLDEIAQHSPTAAIVETFSRIEVSLRTILDEKGVEGVDSLWSVRRLAELAREEGLITTETHDAIEGLTVLRNLAAHGREKDISPQRVHEFIALAQGVMYAIASNAKREPSQGT